MSAPSIIQGIADYLLTCPLLKDGVFRCDALLSMPLKLAFLRLFCGALSMAIANGNTSSTLQAGNFIPWTGCRISRTQSFMKILRPGLKKTTEMDFSRICQAGVTRKKSIFFRRGIYSMPRCRMHVIKSSYNWCITRRSSDEQI